MEEQMYHKQINNTVMECLQEMSEYDYANEEFDESMFSITAEMYWEE